MREGMRGKGTPYYIYSASRERLARRSSTKELRKEQQPKEQHEGAGKKEQQEGAAEGAAEIIR